MKSFFYLLVATAFLVPSQCGAFVPQPPPLVRSLCRRNESSKTRNEITRELEELGNEIKPHLVQTPRGMDEFHDSLVHHLRKELYERDKHVREMQKSLNRIEDQMKSFSVVWKTAEGELQKETRDHQAELNSMRFLLGRIIKLAARRAGNVVFGPFRFVLRKCVGADEKHVEDLDERLY